jgi:hypothetical protein
VALDITDLIAKIKELETSLLEKTRVLETLPETAFHKTNLPAVKELKEFRAGLSERSALQGQKLEDLSPTAQAQYMEMLEGKIKQVDGLDIPASKELTERATALDDQKKSPSARALSHLVESFSKGSASNVGNSKVMFTTTSGSETLERFSAGIKARKGALGAVLALVLLAGAALIGELLKNFRKSDEFNSKLDDIQAKLQANKTDKAANPLPPGLEGLEGCTLDITKKGSARLIELKDANGQVVPNTDPRLQQIKEYAMVGSGIDFEDTTTTQANPSARLGAGANASASFNPGAKAGIAPAGTFGNQASQGRQTSADPVPTLDA